ncbi:MAG: hypothetical protein P8Y23_18740 [Candidatus Lokiarchaeota archaeon]
MATVAINRTPISEKREKPGITGKSGISGNSSWVFIIFISAKLNRPSESLA